MQCNELVYMTKIVGKHHKIKTKKAIRSQELLKMKAEMERYYITTV